MLQYHIIVKHIIVKHIIVKHIIVKHIIVKHIIVKHVIVKLRGRAPLRLRAQLNTQRFAEPILYILYIR